MAIARRIFPLIVTALLAACSTVITKSDKRWGVKYSGTKCAVSRTKQIYKQTKFGAAVETLDVVVSAAADTLLLPADSLMHAATTYANPCPE
jgi:uncharacterized protein YceK